MKENRNMPLGGWLMFFFVIFIIGMASAFIGLIQVLFGPLILNLLSSVLGDLPRLGILSMLVLSLTHLITGIFYLFAIIFIAKKRRTGKSFAILATWIGLVSAVIQYIISYLYIPTLVSSLKNAGQFNSSVYLTEIIIYSILGLVWAIIVTAYFLSSRRVKKTLDN